MYAFHRDANKKCKYLTFSDPSNTQSIISAYLNDDVFPEELIDLIRYFR